MKRGVGDASYLIINLRWRYDRYVLFSRVMANALKKTWVHFKIAFVLVSIQKKMEVSSSFMFIAVVVNRHFLIFGALALSKVIETYR